MEVRQPSVHLVSSTAFPLETLYLVWMQSRQDRPAWPDAKMLQLMLSDDCISSGVSAARHNGSFDGFVQMGYASAEFTRYGQLEDARDSLRQHFAETISMLLYESVPVTENINFTFRLDNIPITLREQLVRHRIGTHVGGSPPDILYMPDSGNLSESSFWSQTARVVPWDNFFANGRYVLPDSADDTDLGPMSIYIGEFVGELTTRRDLYVKAMEHIELVYQALVSSGMPLEDARNLIPLGATHSITWNVNLKALTHILGKRACWIAQVGIWEKVIAGIVAELIKLSPEFSYLGQPVCFKKGKFDACVVPGTNVERVQGTDGDMPPCPIWIREHNGDAMDAANRKRLCQELPMWDMPRDPDTVSGGFPEGHVDYARVKNVSYWRARSERSRKMLDNMRRQYSAMWGMDL